MVSPTYVTNTANNAAALLTGMNIGFGANDNPPAGGGGMNMSSGGGMKEGESMKTHMKGMKADAKAEGESMKTEKKEVKHAAKKKTAKAKAASDTTKK